MFGIIITAAILLIIFYLYFTLSVKPKRTIKQYKKLLESLGYTVIVFPFALLNNSYYSTLWRDQSEKGDAYYFAKHVTSKYDVGLFNSFSDVVLEVYKPELAQEFLGPRNP